MEMVSVIIPIYNLEDYIENTVKSVLAQTYSDIELILVDDGSDDASVEICDRMALEDSRIKVIKKSNGGVSSARNAGIEASNGIYITFVDGDDLLEADAIEVMVNNIRNNDADMCICSSYYRNNTVLYHGVYSVKEEIVLFGELIKRHLDFNLTSFLCTCLFKKELVADIRLDEELPVFEDWKYLFDILMNGVEKASVCRKPLYRYIMRQGSASRSAVNEKKMRCFKVAEEVEKRISEEYPEYASMAECVEARLLVHMLIVSACQGKTDKKYDLMFTEIARKNLKRVMKSHSLLKRFKIYILFTSVSPKMFYFMYKFKYGLKRVLRR